MRDNGGIMSSNRREKTGRNDPCPCGSGKKFKHCCLRSESVPSDTPWSRQRDASDRLTGEMMKFASRGFGEQLPQAWRDFNQTEFPDLIDKYPGEHQIFFPYFLFDWNPGRPALRRGQRPKPGIVAQDYLLEKAKRLPELERLILEESIAQPVSFYEVMQCDPGHGMVLRDVLIGGETEVEERLGSRGTRTGDLIYAQLCRLSDVNTLSRMAPISIPPGRKSEIVALRSQLRQKIAKQNRDLAAEDLIQYSEKIRTVYLDIRDGLRAPPRFCNTDGDPFALHTLTFRIGSAQVAFDALAPLAWGESKEDLLEGADVAADGTLRSVNFDWRKKGNKIHKTWDNTILGHIKISGRTLVADVNSANRATRVGGEIERRLGILAVHQGTRVETPEQMLKNAKQRKGTRALSPDSGTDHLQFDPEAWEEVQARMQEHIQGWVHQKIPALGGRTPMEAVMDPDGREIVEAMLLEWEREKEKPAGPGTIRPDVDALRRLLRL